MLVRCMVGHQIEDQLHATLVYFRQQAVEILQGAEYRVNVRIIGNIIAEIVHWRRIDRRKPDRIHTQSIAQVIQALSDPGQVAHPIAVAVLVTRG